MLLWLLTQTQLTPFVTKRVDPKRSLYTKDIERNGRIITVVDSLKGHDYLQLWAKYNETEVYQHEERRKELEDQKHEAQSKTSKTQSPAEVTE